MEAVGRQATLSDLFIPIFSISYNRCYIVIAFSLR